MKITLAESAGFCFGVARAVKQAEDYIKDGVNACTLGPLIHNPLFVKSLEDKGVYVAEGITEVKDGYTLIIRTHGITKELFSEIEKSGIRYFDATCPFVKKIHRIVEKESADGSKIIIAGDPNHPEVKGIRSYCKTESYVVSSSEELESIKKNNDFSENDAFSLVSQTTFDAKEFKKCEKFAKTLFTNLKIFDTICNATALRQEEAIALAKENDMMVVIGGRNSSNTEKLRKLCSEITDTYLIEEASELSEIKFDRASSVGVTAGASTPDGIIKEVIRTMSESNVNIESAVENQGQVEAVENTEEMSFEQALEESLNSMNNDQKVTGVVMHVAPNEIQVDIGRKQTGYIPSDEYSADPTADPMKELKVGDELTLIIMKTNDVEGTIMLSKRRYDAIKNWDTIVAAKEEGKVLEGVVVEVISKGLIVIVNGVRIFIPASLSGVPKSGRLEEMTGKTVNFVVIDIDKRRRRAVGSIREANSIARKANKEKFWANVEEGQKYTGVVKSLTDYGAFVDFEGVTGMIHRTELSWKRIKHPSEVVNPGDTVEVYIKGLDREKGKISLGFKRIEDNPWEILKRDYPVGTETDVKIVKLTTFGAFAEIFPGMEGLIHISQIAYERIEKPQDVLSIDETVKVKIIEIDSEKRKIGLSIKALLPAPEKKVVEEAPEEDAAPVTMSIDELIAKANEEAAATAEEATDAE
ncbi:MAG: bifunctional 4-hydroxy-3-methylbut-2-enyl diphosphate reductase/30S ribosomal protein S1 [Clostridia bacterium]|nr:bifunctional 4-hydroxy-3-methylbut-2-enyl diphosphate reductase/30S ribosomal protein S1 [Clostridia bacterium]